MNLHLLENQSTAARLHRLHLAVRSLTVLSLMAGLATVLPASETGQVISNVDTEAKGWAEIARTTGVYVAVVIGLLWCIIAMIFAQEKLKAASGGLIIIGGAAVFKGAMELFKS